jgi:hypothetical protein
MCSLGAFAQPVQGVFVDAIMPTPLMSADAHAWCMCPARARCLCRRNHAHAVDERGCARLVHVPSPCKVSLSTQSMATPLGMQSAVLHLASPCTVWRMCDACVISNTGIAPVEQTSTERSMLQDVYIPRYIIYTVRSWTLQVTGRYNFRAAQAAEHRRVASWNDGTSQNKCLVCSLLFLQCYCSFP